MRLLIFGGSFDPPHRGHAALLAAAAEQIRPDRILIVPAWHAPLKGAPTAPAQERLKLSGLGVRDALPKRWRQAARIDGREARAKRRVYTVETLSALQRENPGSELHFLCGRDSAASFNKWRNPQRLRRLAVWWCGGRPGTGPAPSFFRQVAGEIPEISSTALRSALALGENVKGEVEPLVLKQIQRKKLYGLSLLDRLSKTLKAERFQHTISVAKWAEALARFHGEDADKARLAGLLHDLGRGLRPDKMPDYCRRQRLKVPEFRRLSAENPLLLHAYVSEHMARREWNIQDKNILSAVRKHTFGDKTMTRLDKILYVADACAPGRTHAGAAAARRLARKDLDAAFSLCAADKLGHALQRGAWIHPITIQLWNSLLER